MGGFRPPPNVPSLTLPGMGEDRPARRQAAPLRLDIGYVISDLFLFSCGILREILRPSFYCT